MDPGLRVKSRTNLRNGRRNSRTPCVYFLQTKRKGGSRAMAAKKAASKKATAKKTSAKSTAKKSAKKKR